MFFKLKPLYKNYLWGGTKLQEKYGKAAPRPLAESWELAWQPEACTGAASGCFAGRTLGEIFAAQPSLLGNPTWLTAFPLLIKFIDASAPLSIQVHPSDTAARRLAGAKAKGKAELWLILEAAPGAFIYHGFAQASDRATVCAALAEQGLESLLHKHYVHAGDIIYVPPGTIHALGAGLVLAEIQQASDLTYRIYDYGRLDAQQKTRALHLEEALAVLSYAPSPLLTQGSEQAHNNASAQQAQRNARALAAAQDYFQLQLYELGGASPAAPSTIALKQRLGQNSSCNAQPLSPSNTLTLTSPASSFSVILVLAGEGTIADWADQTTPIADPAAPCSSPLALRAGDSFFLAAGSSCQLSSSSKLQLCHCHPALPQS